MLTDEELRVIRAMQAYGIFRQPDAPRGDIRSLLGHIDAQAARIAALEAFVAEVRRWKGSADEHPSWAYQYKDIIDKALAALG